MTTPESDSEINRRDFLKGSSATLVTLLGTLPLMAQTAAETPKPAGPKTRCAVIGLGAWGRQIVETLGTVPQAEIAAVCDTYAPSLRRGGRSAPNAVTTDDYHSILQNPDIPAVIIATPTPLHKTIVLEALKAGKHVYCEAPLAHTVEDARAIALAAKAANRQVFQAGLQNRSDPQRSFLLPFIRSGALGKALMARSQWHRKTSWRQTSPNAEHEKELNWRLSQATSPGLIGELGVHSIDQAGAFLNALPLSVIAFGGILFWNDGRDVPDTVQAVLEYPNGVRLMYDATLANSFEAEYEVYYGSDAAVMIRDSKAWMFKEVDSPLLGWEVYARKDTFYKETGIALVANATKISAQGAKGAEQAPEHPPLFYALEAFLRNSRTLTDGIEDFVSVYGADDSDALAKHISTIALTPAAGYLEGYQATLIALKANEAMLTGRRISIEPGWYELS